MAYCSKDNAVVPGDGIYLAGGQRNGKVVGAKPALNGNGPAESSHKHQKESVTPAQIKELRECPYGADTCAPETEPEKKGKDNKTPFLFHLKCREKPLLKVVEYLNNFTS